MTVKPTTRQLIQFSSYSIALVLPKKALAKLQWQAGESVEVVLDEQKGQIVVRKISATAPIQPQNTTRKLAHHTQITPIDSLLTAPEMTMQSSNITLTQTEEVLPIPEL